MRTIVIILGDNDFGSTFLNLLETIKRVIWYSSNTLSKEQIVKIIHAGIEFHYLAFQNKFEYDGTDIDYLKDIKILFDEEAEEDIFNSHHDSGAWYLDIQSGNINSF